MLKQRKKRDYGTMGDLLTGLLVCTLLLFAFLFITTVILYFGDDPTYRSELWSFGAFILSGGVAGAIICRMTGSGGLLIATLSALELALLLFLIATVSSGVPALPTIVNYAIYVAATALCAFLTLHKPRRRKIRHR